MSHQSGSGARVQVFQRQPDAVLNQNAPGSGTLYTILDTTKNVRIIAFTVQCTWTVQPTPLELLITIDGQTIIYTVANPASATFYMPARYSNNPPTGMVLSTTDPYVNYQSMHEEGCSVKVEARITGGTVSNLSGRVKWAKVP